MNDQKVKLPQLPFLTREMLKFGRDSTFELKLTSKSVFEGTLLITGFSRSGIFTFKVVVDGLSADQVFTFKIPDIPIVVSVNTEDSTFAQGDIYASLSMLINSDVAYPLCSGLVYLQKAISFPATSERDMMGTFSEPTGESVAQPAAAADFTESVPSGKVMRLRALEFLFTTDANAADRIVQILITTSAGPFYRYISPNAHAASLAKQYTCCPQTVGAATSDDNDLIIPIGDEIYVRNGGSVASSVTNMQVGDQLSSIRLYWEKMWIPG